MENRESKDDEVFRRMQKAVEASIRKIGVGKAEGKRGKRRNWEEERRKRKDKKAEKEKDNGSKEGCRRMRNMG